MLKLTIEAARASSLSQRHLPSPAAWSVAAATHRLLSDGSRHRHADFDGAPQNMSAPTINTIGYQDDGASA
jgi:hypothetical protein